jgi:amicyanin
VSVDAISSLRARFAVLSLILLPSLASGQSLLDRSSNVSGDWVGVPGTLYFHFVHRFTASDAPQRKVSNVPTFLLGAGLPKRFLAGFNYSTNSTLAPNFPNEWELFARWSPFAEDLGRPFDLGAQVGYNNAADGVDGEVSIAKRLGIARVIVAGRALSDPLESGNVHVAVASGATVRLGQYFALAGDIASLTDRDSTERVAWSAGLHLAIPLTPHTLSLHATNAPVGTLQGQSHGSEGVRYGFEFTIPLTLRRYFGRRAESPAPDTVVSAAAALVDTAAVDEKVAETTVSAPPEAVPAAPPPSPQPVVTAPPAAPKPATTEPGRTTTKPAGPKPAAPKPVARTRKTTIKNISYMQPRISVTVGTTVEWTNSDPLPHTVTAVDKSFNSGLIQPGKTYRHTFTKAGTYNYFCQPHPFMKGVVVVTAQ